MKNIILDLSVIQSIFNTSFGMISKHDLSNDSFRGLQKILLDKTYKKIQITPQRASKKVITLSKKPDSSKLKKRTKFLINSQNITQIHIIIDRHKTQRFSLIQFSMILIFCLIFNFLENIVKSRKFPPVLSRKLSKSF